MKKKNLISLALFYGVLSLSSALVLAEDNNTELADVISVSSVIEEGGYTYEIDSQTGKATITGYIGTETAINIPSKIDGYDVTVIAPNAFKSMAIESVVLPETIKEIGRYAFGYCSNLKNVQFKEGKEDAIIGESAFCCTAIDSVVVPGNYKTIGDRAFAQSQMKYVEYKSSGSKTPDQTIGKLVFSGYGCNVAEAKLSGTVKEIAPDAFSASTSLKIYGEAGIYAETYANENGHDFYEGTKTSGDYTYDYIRDSASICAYTGTETSLVIPSQIDDFKVIRIDYFAFFDSELQSVTIPPTMERISGQAFYCSNNLKQVTFMEGQNDAVIGRYAFSETGIENLNLPGNYKVIDDFAFEACNKLKSFEYKASKSGACDQIILEYAFVRCRNLENVTLSSSIKEIDATAFINANKVKINGDISEYIISYAKEHGIDYVVPLDKLNITIAAEKTYMTVGEKIILTGNVEGGEESYTYSFLVYNPDTKGWYRFNSGKFNKDNTLTWNATSLGERNFYVEVKDSTGKVVRSESLTVTIKEPLEIKTTLNKKEIELGQTVKITANVSGGKGPYTYSYIIYNQDSKKWHRVTGGFTSKNTYNWKATSMGTRVFYVEVKDATGEVVRSKAVKVSVTPPFEVTAAVDISNPRIGDIINISATATGGEGPYTYSYLIHNLETNEWHRFNKNFTDNDTFAWRASKIGLKEFFVEARDSAGKVTRSKKIEVAVVK